MNDSFERLPLRGLEFVRVEVIAGRFVSMMLSGIAKSGEGHAVVEYSLQFNQITRVNFSDALSKAATVADLSASNESSTSSKYQISFGHAAVEIHGASFVCLPIRIDKFSAEDEKRWAEAKP